MPFPERIVNTKILLVEGIDECIFFGKMLSNLKISGIQIIEVGGKDQFRQKFPVLIKIRGFDKVEKIGLLRDADKSAKSAFTSISGTLKKNRFKPSSTMGNFTSGHPSIGIYILPNNNSKGMLEDLCLDSVKKNPAISCVNSFAKCINELGVKPKNISKSKALAYLAAMPEDCIRVGEAAWKNYWNFNSQMMQSLIRFLKKL